MSLMDDPLISMLRDDALGHEDWATKKFWLHLLAKFVFTEPYWVVSSKQPPVPLGTQRRIDIAVEDFTGGMLSLLLFLEAKNGRAGDGDVAEMETRAYSACYEYYLENEARTRIWAMTCCGPRARFWAFNFETPSNLPTPFFPVEGDHGKKSTYADLKRFELEMMEAFRYIKRNPSPPDIVFNKSPAALAASDLGHADARSASIEDVLMEESITPVRVVRTLHQGPVIETQGGEQKQTEQDRWLPAKCLVQGVVVDGHKYEGNPGIVYWTMNSILD